MQRVSDHRYVKGNEKYQSIESCSIRGSLFHQLPRCCVLHVLVHLRHDIEHSHQTQSRLRFSQDIVIDGGWQLRYSIDDGLIGRCDGTTCGDGQGGIDLGALAPTELKTEGVRTMSGDYVQVMNQVSQVVCQIAVQVSAHEFFRVITVVLDHSFTNKEVSQSIETILSGGFSRVE